MVCVLLLSRIRLPTTFTLKRKVVLFRHVAPFEFTIREHLGAAIALEEGRVMAGGQTVTISGLETSRELCVTGAALEERVSQGAAPALTHPGLSVFEVHVEGY